MIFGVVSLRQQLDQAALLLLVLDLLDLIVYLALNLLDFVDHLEQIRTIGLLDIALFGLLLHIFLDLLSQLICEGLLYLVVVVELPRGYLINMRQ